MNATLVDHVLILFLCLGGFACLAMAMVRHQEDVLGHELPPGRTRTLRWVGWLLLLSALWLAVLAMGWAAGLVAYSGHTSAGAGLVFIALMRLDRWRDGRRSRPSR